MNNIRFYLKEDYENLITILKEADLYDEVWETKDNLNKKIELDSESIIVYETDNKIVGCVFITQDGWNAFIWRLAVKKEYRKKGIGNLLMNKAKEIIKKRN